MCVAGTANEESCIRRRKFGPQSSRGTTLIISRVDDMNEFKFESAHYVGGMHGILYPDAAYGSWCLDPVNRP